MNILITGATGFVGNALVRSLINDGHQVSAVVRYCSSEIPKSVSQFELGDLSLINNEIVDKKMTEGVDIQSPDEHALCNLLNDTDVIVHLAARVHVMDDKAEDPVTEFKKINTDFTINLAKKAAQSGVKRFIFLSTIKVNGESSTDLSPFKETDNCSPVDPYAISKLEAEKGLLKTAQTTGMEVVIIRPPLVYGPGVKGNFASMMRWTKKGIPLPLGAVHNYRSLLALDNLVNFIRLCLTHPKAANETFLVADGEDVSSTELLRSVARAQGKRARLVPVPVSWMRFVARVTGRQAVAERLFGSLQIDITKARQWLGWKPVVSMDEQLARMADGESRQQNEK